MSASLLVVPVTGPEERHHGTWFGNYLAYDTMAKASVHPFHPRLVQGLSLS